MRATPDGCDECRGGPQVSFVLMLCLVAYTTSHISNNQPAEAAILNTVRSSANQDTTIMCITFLCQKDSLPIIPKYECPTHRKGAAQIVDEYIALLAGMRL
eukprot:scaffold21570_cov43-Cyclotella_meneghiniana.AAC.3